MREGLSPCAGSDDHRARPAPVEVVAKLLVDLDDGGGVVVVGAGEGDGHRVQVLAEQHVQLAGRVLLLQLEELLWPQTQTPVEGNARSGKWAERRPVPSESQPPDLLVASEQEDRAPLAKDVLNAHKVARER